jgi:hypothetical protein
MDGIAARTKKVGDGEEDSPSLRSDASIDRTPVRVTARGGGGASAAIRRTKSGTGGTRRGRGGKMDLSRCRPTVLFYRGRVGAEDPLVGIAPLPQILSLPALLHPNNCRRRR